MSITKKLTYNREREMEKASNASREILGLRPAPTKDNMRQRIAELERELQDLTDWCDMTLVGPHGRKDASGWRKELGEIIDRVRAKFFPNHAPDTEGTHRI